MSNRKIIIIDDGSKYIWVNNDNSLKIRHGMVLKDLIYISEKTFCNAYSCYINMKRHEDEFEKIDMSSAREEYLRLDARMNSEINNNKEYNDINDLEEAFSATQAIVYGNNADDQSVIKDEQEIIQELITNDLYNVGRRSSELQSVEESFPAILSVKNYKDDIIKLLLSDYCSDSLKEYCELALFEMSFSYDYKGDIYFISSLDQFIQLEIRNRISKRAKKTIFASCEICKRLFPHIGPGSYKKTRCSYSLKRPCNSIKSPKTELDAYRERLARRIDKHNQRNDNLINSNINWVQRANKRIKYLADTKKMNTQDIISYMDGDSWWKTVKKYGKIKGVDWDRF